MASKGVEQAFLELARCFLEGPAAPPERELPPDTFSLRVWQVIPKGQVPKGQKPGELHLTIEGLTAPKLEEVEVVFEGDKNARPPQPWKGAELTFDLPASWVEEPGPRFVTVCIREKGAAAAAKKLKKMQEGPKAIIRIVPAPLNSSAALDYDDHRPPEDGDD